MWFIIFHFSSHRTSMGIFSYSLFFFFQIEQSIYYLGQKNTVRIVSFFKSCISKFGLKMNLKVQLVQPIFLNSNNFSNEFKQISDFFFLFKSCLLFRLSHQQTGGLNKITIKVSNVLRWNLTWYIREQDAAEAQNSNEKCLLLFSIPCQLVAEPV